ncbi:MAG: hypothetical protein M3R14_02665 [Acidobacteriota bacterium]|nr:hypothetical protein [Acidobacteriota bacterium]
MFTPEKKREQEAMKVGNDFGSTLLRAKPVEQCDLYFAFIRNTSWNERFRIGVWKDTGQFLVLAFGSEEKSNYIVELSKRKWRWLGGVFLVDD